MKKFVSSVLCLILFLAACPVTAWGTQPEKTLGFAVASDLHVNLPEDELTKTNDDPIFWYANRRASMNNESGFILDSFLVQCASDDRIQFVLLSGDLADHGKTIPEEHMLVAEKLRKFEEVSGKEVYVICGNHDLGNKCSTGKDEFKKIYAEFGYDHALASREDDCSYTADLGDKYRLIAFDSTNYSKSTSDGITSAKLRWIKQQTAQSKEDGRYPIMMMHHNLLEHMPIQSVISGDFIVKNHLVLAEQFANQGIKLVLTGHEHCSDATSFTSSRGNIITDFATTALSMYPLTYRVFSLTEETITYKSQQVKSIDSAAVSACVSGYTQLILSAMDSDLNAFAKGFIKAGIQHRLSLSLSAEKIGIKQDAIYYDLVMKVVGRLTELLAMPLYGKGSVQSLAEKYGIILPDSEYKNGWDLATELVAAHYAGSESNTLDSPEITILLRTAAVILREEFSLVSDEMFLSAARAISKYFGMLQPSEKLCASVFGGISPCEYLLVAIASPFLYSFAYDDDGVDDNSGSIIGYGTADSGTNAKNIKANFSAFFDRIALYIQLIFKEALINSWCTD